MSSEDHISKQDPDYDEFIETPESYRRINEVQSNRDNTVKKIRDILERHFNGEIHAKEEEVILVEKRISQAKAMLDKLRAYLLANYYGCNGKLMRGQALQRKKRTIRGVGGRKRVCRESLSQQDDRHLSDNDVTAGDCQNVLSEVSASSKKSKESTCIHVSSDVNSSSTEKMEHVEDTMTSNRFYATKNVIIGNISKFIPLEKREKNDQATHKWMVYVRGPPDSSDISSFIKRVWFILHPSYMPNDIIEVSKPPFTVTRRGWGEFPVRIQLVFCDPRNKPVDIIHNLKLDKTYTGLQTLGAETRIALELQRHAVEETKSSLLSFGITAKKEKETVRRELDILPKKQSNEGNTNITSKFESEVEYAEDGFESARFPDISKELYGEKFDSKGYFMSSAVSSPLSIATTEHPRSHAVSPVVTPAKDTPNELDACIEDILVKNISRFPMIKEDRDMTKLHFCAKTIAQYKSWSFSKRRASEWQRALDIKRFVIKSGIVDQISTKDVMLWCRKHGFTPSEIEGCVVDVSNLDFCPNCGKCFPDDSEVMNRWCSNCLSNRIVKNAYSLTSFEDMLDNLFIQENKLLALQQENNYLSDVENSVIDVVGDDMKINEINEGQSLIDISQLPPENPSLEQDWIYEAAAQIEVHLPSLTLNGKRIPVLLQLLHAAMKSFVRDILTQSYAQAKDNQLTLEPVVVTPLHILQALKEIPHMDFLTNNFLGIQEEDGNI